MLVLVQGQTLHPTDQNIPRPFGRNPQLQVKKTPHSSTNIPSPVPNTAVHSSSSLRNIASPIPDYGSNHVIPQLPPYSAFTSAPSHASSAALSAGSSSQVPPNNATRQPPRVVRPGPQLPPKPNHTITANANPSPRANSSNDSAVHHAERAVQPTPTASTTSPNPPQRPVTQQTGRQSTSNPPRLGPQTPAPQEHTHTHTPALAQWAESQGYRIDQLMNAASRNAPPPGPRTRVRRNPGQPRNAMPPFNPAVQDVSVPYLGSANRRTQRMTSSEVPLDRGVVHVHGNRPTMPEPELITPGGRIQETKEVPQETQVRGALEITEDRTEAGTTKGNDEPV
ncbi:unnamed protein product [Rhizoctonia solani]|uniref:Uncharacterized protein n=1 Tax=Rhizoctonia solani TaxID=456999 RepID=A0A8H2WKU5_9AGAM|nr:unnamed protein product [Rhizoctonia solani]